MSVAGTATDCFAQPTFNGRVGAAFRLRSKIRCLDSCWSIILREANFNPRDLRRRLPVLEWQRRPEIAA